MNTLRLIWLSLVGFFLCSFLGAGCVAAVELEDPAVAADMQQIRKRREESIAELQKIVMPTNMTLGQRREMALQLSLETLSAAISAPYEAAQVPLVSFLQDEVLEKTMYQSDARLTFLFGELALQLIGANDGLMSSKLLDRTVWITSQTRILREVTRWHVAVSKKIAEKPAPSIPLPFTNWQAITTHEYLAAAHGRLAETRGHPEDSVRGIREQRTIERFVKRVRVSGKITDAWKQATPEERIRLRKACANSPLATLLPADQGEKP